MCFIRMNVNALSFLFFRKRNEVNLFLFLLVDFLSGLKIAQDQRRCKQIHFASLLVNMDKSELVSRPREKVSASLRCKNMDTNKCNI